jgi:type IV fimbrial biogenesis protein FimT
MLFPLDPCSAGRAAHGATGDRSAAGFTLVELMVTVAVLAIIAAIAYPSFTSVINSNRLAGAANDLLGDLQYARSEAIRRSAHVAVCASTDATTCAGAAGNWSSWIVLLDNPTAADEVLRVGHVKAPIQMLASPAIAANGGSIVFRSNGMARDSTGALLAAGIGACIATDSPKQNARVVQIGSGSRISSKREDGGGKCIAPTNK